MKLRNAILAFALMLSMIAVLGIQPASAVNQDDNSSNNTLTAYVQVNVSGVFDAYFCAAPSTSYGNLGTVNLTSTSPLVTNQVALLAVCYDDSKPARPQFRTYMISTNFTSGPDTILATNFKVTKTYNVGQSQWSSGPGGPGIGDIGFNGPLGLNVGPMGTPPGNWVDWTTANELSSWRYVQFGYAGKGTSDGTGTVGPWVSGWAPLGSVGLVEVTLGVPVNTPAGYYTSTMTLEINFATP